jgi:hypothetical protein
MVQYIHCTLNKGDLSGRRRTAKVWELGNWEHMLQSLRDLFPWEPIKNCPGRFVVRKLGDQTSPQEILDKIQGGEHQVIHFVNRKSHGFDNLCVVVFNDETGGGLITFCKDTSFVHTLNEPSGLERKLRGLGLSSLLTETRKE